MHFSFHIIKFNSKFLFLVFFSFSLQYGFSQNTATRKVINEYTDYLNHINLYISATHYSVKHYNIKILSNFKKPDYYYPKTDYFELKCQPSSLECNEKLDLKNFYKEKIILKEKIRKALIDEKIKKEFIKSIDNIDKIFHQLISKIITIENQKFNKKYFLDFSNIKKQEKLLNNYKINVELLDYEIQKISNLNIKLFKEQSLPKPLERTKKLTFLIKESIKNFKKNNTELMEMQLVEIQKLIDLQDLGTDLMAMQSFGDFDYTDNNQTQERANIERLAQSVVDKQKKLLNNCNCENPYDFGISTYEEVSNSEIHRQIFKIERATALFNDNTGQSVVANYNNYIERANQSILKIVGVVLPFEIIQFEDLSPKDTIIVIKEDTVKIKEESIFVKEDITTLDGSKTNNIVMLLDISASMKVNKKITNLKNAVNHLIDLLRDQDILTVIIYSSETKLIFNSIDKKLAKKELKDLINNISPQGGSNIKNALETAYKYCNKYYIPNANNKIIVATDGFFEVEENIISNNKKIILSTFHFKSKNDYKKEKKILQKMAKIGNGTYTLIKEENDALKALVFEAKEK